MQAATSCINFSVGDRVNFDWKGFESQDFFEKCRTQYGKGPFRVVEIKPTTETEKNMIGHHQIIILSYENGAIIKNLHTQEPREWSGRCLKKA